MPAAIQPAWVHNCFKLLCDYITLLMYVYKQTGFMHLEFPQFIFMDNDDPRCTLRQKNFGLTVWWHCQHWC